jgi:hypothetical protein
MRTPQSDPVNATVATGLSVEVDERLGFESLVIDLEQQLRGPLAEVQELRARLERENSHLREQECESSWLRPVKA